MTIRSFPSIATQTKTPVGQVEVGGFIYHVQNLNSKSQPPHSRPRDPSRSMMLPHVRYWVRAFVRGCVGGWIGTCDHACVGARASERDMRSTSSNLKASRREARWATSCLPPHVAESARLSFRMPAWRVAAVVPMCVGVSVVSEVELPASSSDRNERQTNT